MPAIRRSREGIHVKFDKVRARFYWEVDVKKRKYHMIKWADLCRPNIQGGLGITNTKLMNLALIVKWIWKLSQNDSGHWARILKAKYFPECKVWRKSATGGRCLMNWQRVCRLLPLGGIGVHDL